VVQRYYHTDVLVTGASRGIGRAIALRPAGSADAAGVAVNYRRSTEKAGEVVGGIEDRGGNAVAIGADVSDPAAATDLVETAAAELGGLDAVVNNAGIVDPDPVTDIDDDRWRRVIDTNLSGTFYVVRAAVPNLVDGDGGEVVNVSSIGGTGGTVDPATPRARRVCTA